MNVRGEKLKEVMRCPMDVWDVRDPGAIITAGPYTFSYTLNDRIGRILWNGLPGNSATGGPLKSKVIHNPSQKILVAEEYQPNDGRWNVQLVTAASGDLLTVRHVPGMRPPTV